DVSRISGRPTPASCTLSLHDALPIYVGAVGHDVVDGGPAAGLLDQGEELLLGGVALDLEVHTDLPVAVAHLVGHTEDPQQVDVRSEEHTSELQSRENLVCRLLLEKKK